MTFWDHVDFAIKRQKVKEFTWPSFLPGESGLPPKQTNPCLIQKNKPINMGGSWADRYRKSPNLIWVLGGDRHPDERASGIELWRAMAEGIAME